MNLLSPFMGGWWGELKPGDDSPHNSTEREPRYSIHYYSFYERATTLSLAPSPLLSPSISFHSLSLPPFSSTDSPDVFSNEHTRVSIVPRYRLVRERLGRIVRPFTHLRPKQPIYAACHSPRNRLHMENKFYWTLSIDATVGMFIDSNCF